MSEARYGPLADRIARQNGIPPALFRRLIGAESSWNPTAGSNMGARGLAQLMPATARGLGVRNILDPQQNLTGGARYLAQQYRTFGRWDLALAAYNAGPGAVRRYNGIPPFRETQAYVPRVLGGQTFPGLGEAQQAPAPAAAPPDASEQFAQTAGAIPGTPINSDRLWMLLENQRKRSLRGIMPAPGFQNEIAKIAQQAMTRTQEAVQPGGSYPAVPGLPQWTVGGTPNAGTHTLGNWQSDLAYDFMGKAGDPVVAGVEGVVTNVSGSPGGNPRFAGYGITVRTPQGSLFYKHLGSKRVKVGDRIQVGTVLGTLDGAVQGGAHLHLGATHRALLDRQRDFYGRAGQQGHSEGDGHNHGPSSAPAPGGDWGGAYQPAMGAAEIARRHGLVITSSKRDRQGTASGGVSDHWSGSTNSYAVDLGWGGSRPTAASDRAASEIVASLGGPRNWGATGGNFVKTVNGLRWQVIYRSDVGGNHWNHIHVGVKRV